MLRAFFRKEKKGWLKFTEAVVAIMIMSSVLIVLYVNNTPEESYSGYVSDLQVRILMDIEDNDKLRDAVLTSSEEEINPNLSVFFEEFVPKNFNYTLLVCNISNMYCNKRIETPFEVYVEDKIISSTINNYDPKLLRFYVWRKG